MLASLQLRRFRGLADCVPENRHFGGVPAPLLQLEIDGDACGLAQGSLCSACKCRSALTLTSTLRLSLNSACARRGAVNSLAYITVNTGIEGGMIIGGAPVHGIAHPEMGHIFPRRHHSDRVFDGVGLHYGDCLEALASGPAILGRWGMPLSELPSIHPAHDMIAFYLAQLCHTLVAMTAVPVIVLGGGVMQTDGLIGRVRQQASVVDRGYLPGGPRHRIETPKLGKDSGITGALILDRNA